MPLREGRDAVAFNIRRLMEEYESSGMIGDTKPRNKKHALQIAKAIAMSKAGKGK